MVRKFRLLFVLAAPCYSLAGPVDQPFACAQQFAKEVIKATTGKEGTRLPKELIYPQNLLALPSRQIELLRGVPAMPLFHESEFNFSIAAAGESERVEGVTYPFLASHRILVFFADDRAQTTVFSADIARLEGRWWVVVPILEPSMERLVADGLERVKSEVMKLEGAISMTELMRLKESLKENGKLSAIKAVTERFHVSNDAAMVYLSRKDAEPD